MEKSDSVEVAVKSTNKGTRVPAEPMEPRTEPKGNPGGQSARRTQCRESASQAADRIRHFVCREPRERLTALLTRERTERRHQRDGGTRPLGVAAKGRGGDNPDADKAEFLGFSYAWSNQRVAVSARQGNPREEPDALNGHVRIWCARRTGRR